jgi:hypothetical protein
VLQGGRDNNLGPVDLAPLITDLTVAFSFAGVTDCDEAGVDELDIVILQNGEVYSQEERLPCINNLVVTFPNLPIGEFDFNVRAYDRTNVQLYEGDFPVVAANRFQDDAFNLTTLGGETEQRGTLLLYWGFIYPTTNVRTDCAIPGVADLVIRAEAVDTDEAPFEEVVPCTDAGGYQLDLAAGRYDLRVSGWMRYNNTDVSLYDSDVLRVTVGPNMTTDLGTLALPRITENFGTIGVAPSVVGNTCAAAGITNVTVTVTRSGLTVEDNFPIDCSAQTSRTPFVPGTYTVAATATGTAGTYSATTNIDVAPGAAVNATTALALP